MVEIKFKSINEETRKVTLEVDGVDIVRTIPVKFVGTVENYISDLARGLVDEHMAAQVKADTLSTTLSGGDTILNTPEE